MSNTDPVMTMLEQKGDVKIISDTRTLKGTHDVFGGPMPAACFYSHADFVQKNPNTCQALANAIVHGLKWLQTAGPSDIIKTVPESYLLGRPRAVPRLLQQGARSHLAGRPDGGGGRAHGAEGAEPVSIRPSRRRRSSWARPTPTSSRGAPKTDSRHDPLAPAMPDFAFRTRIDITVTFHSPDDPAQRYTAVADTTLRIRAGEFVSVVGPTGCGKSTLLNIGAGLLEASSGDVKVFGQPLRASTAAPATCSRPRP